MSIDLLQLQHHRLLCYKAKKKTKKKKKKKKTRLIMHPALHPRQEEENKMLLHPSHSSWVLCFLPPPVPHLLGAQTA